MPPPGERVSNPCVYIVSGILLVAIVGGGALLMLYVTLPENEETAWFSIAGMLLVCTPWVLWTMTYLYRSVSMRIAARYGGAAPAAAAINPEEGMVNSPRGVQRFQEAGDPNGDCSSQISHESELPLFVKA